jgi:integrase/recombinase XerD
MIESSKDSVSDLLDRYNKYMEKTQGLADSTRRSYLLISKRLLESISRRGKVDQSRFTVRTIRSFVISDAHGRQGQGPNTTIAATRSFLRFLKTQGLKEDLALAVPRIKCSKHATLPDHLTKAEIQQVLSFSNDGTLKGLRNYALLLLLSRLGLRIEEAANLMLENIDWHQGVILIRAGKNRCERKLPLAKDLGEALLAYLKHARPIVKHRHLFTQLTEPFAPYDGTTLGKSVKRLLACAGVKRVRLGAHLFRHYAAYGIIATVRLHICFNPESISL